MYYKRTQKALPEIACELPVDGVIEGSAIRGEGRILASAQLLHAPTDTHLWAENYERDVRDVRDVRDILALQAEMAELHRARDSGRGHPLFRRFRVKTPLRGVCLLPATRAANPFRRS
jgi:hypothetical protein